jgi:recombinational DNA repair protein RecR
MLKDIIRSIEDRINELEKAKLYAQTELIAFKKLLPGLKKEAELQEEMVNYIKLQEIVFCQNCKSLIENDKCLDACQYRQEGGMKLVEKYYGKKWEKIIKQ